MALSTWSLLAVAVFLGLAGVTLAAGAPEPAPARSSAGAVHTDAVLSGTRTSWGHDNNAKGVERVGADVLARLDLFRELWTHAPSAECKSGLQDFLEARERLLLWALKMQESSVILPDALLSGNMYSLGNFDACAALPAAMFCLPDVVVRPVSKPGVRDREHPGDEISPYEPPHGQNATLWDWFKISGNRRRYRRDLMQWAVCLPAACHRDAGPGRLGDALAASIDGLAKKLGVELLLRLNPNDCTDFTARGSIFEEFFRRLQERPLFLYGSVFILSFPLAVLVASVRAACRGPDAASQTTLDKPNLTSPTYKLDCFAIQANWCRLRRKQPSQIHSIQGLRTITMFMIIFGHRAMYLFGGPLSNPEYVENSFTRALKMSIINGTVIVSTFFVISGFLEARLSMIHIGKLRRYNLIVVMQHYVIRYLRLLPALAVVLAVEVLWVEFMGDGPMWDQVVGQASRDCKANWWAHLLFVNNYVSPDSRCMIQTWFASAVLQLYVATPLLMWLVSRWTLRALWPGCLLLGMLLVAAAGALYATTVSLGLHPMLHTYPQVLRRQNVILDETFIHQYVATHTNAVPYVVGLIVGTLFYLAQLRDWRPSKRMSTVLFVAIPFSLLMQSGTVVSGVFFFLPTFTSHPLLDAAYGPARLLVFSLPTAIIIFTCGIGAGGVIETVLTWRPMVALGRLTYSVYLVHLTIITMTAGYTRHPQNISNFMVGSSAIADIVTSYVIGLVLHLCVEAPCANLQSIAVGYWFQKSPTGTAPQGREETPPPPEDFEDADDLRSVEEASVHTRSRRASSVTSRV